MDESPIAQLLAALDELDVDAVVALYAPDAHLLTVDGQEAAGIDDVRQLLTKFLGGLRSTSHQITGQWHDGDTWIAEFDATYELEDSAQTGPLPRAVVLRQGPDGIADARFYGAHEHQLADHPQGGLGTWVRGHWIPPL